MILDGSATCMGRGKLPLSTFVTSVCRITLIVGTFCACILVGNQMIRWRRAKLAWTVGWQRLHK
eukprot:scaffold202124_cov27-Prasinocladus_malaysianus.AAC.1